MNKNKGEGGSNTQFAAPPAPRINNIHGAMANILAQIWVLPCLQFGNVGRVMWTAGCGLKCGRETSFGHNNTTALNKC